MPRTPLPSLLRATATAAAPALVLTGLLGIAPAASADVAPATDGSRSVAAATTRPFIGPLAGVRRTARTPVARTALLRSIAAKPRKDRPVASPIPVPATTSAPATLQPVVGTTAAPVATTAPIASVPPPALPRAFTAWRSADFAAGFGAWDLGGPSVQPNPGATVALDNTASYDGTPAARASIPAGSGNKFARTLWGNTSGQPGALNLGEGTDFTYGMALNLPVGFYESMQSYFVPMRWDNFGTTNVSRGGLSMWADGSMRLFRERAGIEGQINLLGDATFRLSEGTWHWLEVRQKLSTRDGSALNELFVDGRLVGSSTTANYYGEPVSAIRYGVVAIADGSQTKPLTVLYDRAVLGTGHLGPRV